MVRAPKTLSYQVIAPRASRTVWKGVRLVKPRGTPRLVCWPVAAAVVSMHSTVGRRSPQRLKICDNLG